MSTTTTVRAIRRNVFGTIPAVSSGGNTQGDVLSIAGGRVGVVEGSESFADGDPMALAVAGQFDILKQAASDTYAVDAPVWYDPTTKKAYTAYAAGYLYAGRCVKASASGDAYVYTDLNVGPGSAGAVPPISLTGATVTLDSSYFGRTMTLNRAGGIGATLPAATGSGAKMRFVVGTVSTTGYVLSSAPTSDIFKGSIPTLSDGAAAVLAYAASTNSNVITLNGTTTGGVSVGDYVELEDVAAGVWAVRGFTTSSGTEATPYSHV
jgi:hypothetical protein